MHKQHNNLSKITLALGLALLIFGCDTRGTGLGAATGPPSEDRAGRRSAADRSGTARAIMGKRAPQHVVYALSGTDHIADHEGIRLILASQILFEPRDASLKPDARVKLREVSEVLEYYGPDPIKISGHADDKGDANQNRELSVRRAEAVKQYLVENYGIDANRIETVGYANEFPIAGPDDSQDPENRSADINRRVEIKIITAKGLPTFDEQEEDE
jgi:outer membrane protein OmpA-like peptidoglycan-associated protein